VGTQRVFGYEIDRNPDCLLNFSLNAHEVHEAAATIETDQNIHIALRGRFATGLRSKQAGINDSVLPALVGESGFIESKIGHKRVLPT